MRLEKSCLFIFMFLVTISSSYALINYTSLGNQTFSASNVNRVDAIGNYPMVSVVALHYEPYPARPGEYFDIWVKVQNIGNTQADNVRVTLMQSYPFSIDKNETKTIGKLPSLQEAIVKFEKVRVDDDAIEGDNELKFLINVGGGYEKEPLTKKVIITVASVSPIFEVYVNSTPEKIPAGGKGNIDVSIKNTAGSILEDVVVKLDLPSSAFVPIGFIAEKKLDHINPYETKNLNFEIMALGSADSKAYSVPIIMTYHDKAGNQYSKNNSIGLLIGEDPKYILSVENSDAFSKNTKGKLTLSLADIGNVEMKYTVIELIETDDYTILSNPKVYVGNMEGDDFETVEFTIYMKSRGDIPLKVRLIYKDSYNQDIEKIEYVTLRSYSSSEISKYTLTSNGNGSGSYLFLIIVLCIIFSYLTYKNWRRDKNLVLAMKSSVDTMITKLIRAIKWFRWSNIRRIPRRLRIYFASR